MFPDRAGEYHVELELSYTAAVADGDGPGAEFDV